MGKLTDLAIRKAKPIEGRQIELWDGTIKGFGLRISPDGTKSFVLVYRVDGRVRRLMLGRHPSFNLSDARRLAQEALRNKALGKTPTASKGTARTLQEDDLRFDAFETWLDGSAGTEILKPFEGRLRAWVVTRAGGNPRFEEPACVAPIGPELVGQGS